MKKLKDLFMENKKNILIGLLSLVIIIVLIAVIVSTSSSKSNTSKENKLEDKLTAIGVDFYENVYYSGMNDENKKKLPTYAEDGIKISIEMVEVSTTVDDETKKMLEDKKCDTENTKIAIYPKDPYGQKDYTIKIELACEK